MAASCLLEVGCKHQACLKQPSTILWQAVTSPPLPFMGDCGLQSSHPLSPALSQEELGSHVSACLSLWLLVHDLVISSDLLLCSPLQPPPRWLPKNMSPPGTAPALKSLSQAPRLYPQPSGLPAHSQPLVGHGFRTQQGSGPCFLPRHPFCLHFPPSPAEVPWSIIQALFCQHPQRSWPPISWSHPAGSSPALEEAQQPPASRRPPPPPLPGAEPGKPVLGGFSLLPDMHTYQFSWPGLSLPSWPLALPTQHTAAPHRGWEDHLPILNTVHRLPPAFSLGRWPTSSSTETVEASPPPSTVSVPPNPVPMAEVPSSSLGSFCRCPESPHPTP